MLLYTFDQVRTYTLYTRTAGAAAYGCFQPAVRSVRSVSKQVAEPATKEQVVDAGRHDQAHSRSPPHRGAAPSSSGSRPSTIAATSSLVVHCGIGMAAIEHSVKKSFIHSSLAMEALESTRMAAELDLDQISKSEHAVTSALAVRSQWSQREGAGCGAELRTVSVRKVVLKFISYLHGPPPPSCNSYGVRYRQLTELCIVIYSYLVLLVIYTKLIQNSESARNRHQSSL